MKAIKLICGLIMSAMVSSSGVALADRGHGGGHSGGHGGGHVHSHIGLGFYFGAPYAYPYYPYPYYYTYPYPYYPPVVTVPAEPPVYIEKGSPQSESQGYWYHCDNPVGYYPYIKKCPGGWDKVVPTPPPEE